jgi:translation initiation factor IF-3
MTKPPYNTNTNRKDKNTTMKEPTMLANERIRAPEVRLINAEGTNVGVVKTRDALFQAQRDGLDLVVINQQVTPMVVKILDLNKHLYAQKLAAKERAKKSRESEIQLKEIQLRPVTDKHDIQVKAAKAREFLASNCRVKLVIKFRGREMAFSKLGFGVVDEFVAQIGGFRYDKEPGMQGNQITAILAPVKTASDKPASA